MRARKYNRAIWRIGGMGLSAPRPPRARGSGHSLSRQAKFRLAFIEHHASHGANAAATCRHFQISRDTFYRWYRRYDPHDLSSLEDKSRAPKTRRTPTTPTQVVDLVLRVRDGRPEWSKYKIAVVVRRDHGVSVSASTCGRILKRYGRIDTRVAAARRRAARRRKRARRPRELVASHPGDLVQIDTKHLYWWGSTRRYQFVAVDLATRMKVSRVFCTGSSRSAAAFLAHTLACLPFAVSAIQTDNGSEFLGEFDQACKQAGVAHFFSYPHCPKNNAVVERQIQTEIDEFHAFVEPTEDLDEFNDLVAAWDRFYNEVRPHQSLAYLTPMAYYRHHMAPGRDQEP